MYKPFDDYSHPNPLTYLNQKRWNDEIEKSDKPTIIKSLKLGNYVR